jgi:hypothetical protein
MAGADDLLKQHLDSLCQRNLLLCSSPDFWRLYITVAGRDFLTYRPSIAISTSQQCQISLLLVLFARLELLASHFLNQSAGRQDTLQS